MLAEDSRRSLADIGGRVGLSATAVNERMRRMRAEGAIKRYCVDVDAEAVGLPILVFVFVALGPGAPESEFREFAHTHPGVLECHHVTGGWSYLLKLRARDLAEVEEFLDALKARHWLGRSETMIALSSPVPGDLVPKPA